MLKRWSNKFAAAVGIILLLLPLSASAVIQSPMQSRADQSFAYPEQSSFMPLVPAVSSADSSFYFNELTCRNNPMEGMDPYGLVTWVGWDSEEDKKAKEAWLTTAEGAALYERIEREEANRIKAGLQSKELVITRKAALESKFNRDELVVVVGKNLDYETYYNEGHEYGLAEAGVLELLHHELSHYDDFLADPEGYKDFRAVPYKDDTMRKKWWKPAEKYAVEQTNKLRKELRKNSGNTSSYPARIQYDLRKWEYRFRWVDGLLEDPKKAFYKGMAVSSLHGKQLEEYREELERRRKAAYANEIYEQ